MNNITTKTMKFKGHTPQRFETIFEQEQRLKEEAKKLAELNKNKKVIKYDLKR